jgi:adenylate kinase family enzyme
MNPSLYLITGPSGAGKTTLSEHLAAQNHTSIDADSVPGLCFFVNKNNKPVPYPAHADANWWSNHHYVWELDRLAKLLATFDANPNPIFICGNASNIRTAWDKFNGVFYLDLPQDVMIKRLTGKNRENSFGRRVDEQAQLLRWVDGFKAEMLEAGAIPINATQPLEIVAQDILERIKAAAA